MDDTFFHGPPSIREERRGVPSAASKCGGSTWKYSSVEAVCCSGVPLTNSVVGARPANPRTDAVVMVVTEARTTLNEKVAGSVSTTSVAVSVNFRRIPTSAWPTMYRLAANGVAVVSAAVTQCPPCGGHACQSYATWRLRMRYPDGRWGGAHERPFASTTPPSVMSPAIFSVP